MRPTFLISLLATAALVCSIARGGERRFEESTVPASLPKAQPTKTVFATVKVTGEVGEDE